LVADLAYTKVVIACDCKGVIDDIRNCSDDISNFFEKKEYIYIKRYQLHPASATTQYPNNITDVKK
jgi:hypothetical protein